MHTDDSIVLSGGQKLTQSATVSSQIWKESGAVWEE